MTRNPRYLNARWRVLPLVLGALLLVGCGSASKSTSGQPREVRSTRKGASSRYDVIWRVAPHPIAGVRQRTIGKGARAAVLLWRNDRRPPRKAVIFLHGYEPEPPSVGGYGDWIRHLTAEGDSVIYPVYENAGTKPEGYLANAVAGIRAGLRAIDADPASVVAIGHTTGGALAVDYAAVAEMERLPAPRAVIAVYPGRHPSTGFEVSPTDLSRIPASTRLMVIAGPGDPIPRGDQEAHALLAEATNVPPTLRDLINAPYVRSPGPFPRSLRPRHSFWAPADHLITQARAAGR